jgi:hypothetical protein
MNLREQVDAENWKRNTRSPSVEHSLWKRQWSCRKTTTEWRNEWMGQKIIDKESMLIRKYFTQTCKFINNLCNNYAGLHFAPDLRKCSDNLQTDRHSHFYAKLTFKTAAFFNNPQVQIWYHYLQLFIAQCSWQKDFNPVYCRTRTSQTAVC